MHEMFFRDISTFPLIMRYIKKKNHKEGEKKSWMQAEELQE